MILVEGNQRAHLHFTVVFTCGLDESSVAETLVFHAIDHNYGEGIFCKLSLAANLMFSISLFLILCEEVTKGGRSFHTGEGCFHCQKSGILSNSARRNFEGSEDI